MVSKQQALTANEFHYGTCTRVVGPRGGITEHSEVWRRNGKTQVWKTSPDAFQVPVKRGLKEYAYITAYNASAMHTSEDCPLNDPNYRSTK